MRARVPTPRAQELTNLPLDQTMDYPRPYKLRNFYTEKEVAQHNCHDDCWVSIFNKVYDLTKLLQENYKKPECDPITLAAGTDITHWFDLETFCVSNLLKSYFESLKHSSMPKVGSSNIMHQLAVTCISLQLDQILIGIRLTSRCLGGKTIVSSLEV